MLNEQSRLESRMGWRPTLLINCFPRLDFLRVVCRGWLDRCAARLFTAGACCSSTGRAGQSIALFSISFAIQDARFSAGRSPQDPASLGIFAAMNRASPPPPRMTAAVLRAR